MSNRPPIEYINYFLCKEMGWSYQELLSTPREVVEEFLEIIKIDKKLDKKHARD